METTDLKAEINAKPLQTPTDGYEASDEERTIGQAIAQHLLETFTLRGERGYAELH